MERKEEHQESASRSLQDRQYILTAYQPPLDKADILAMRDITARRRIDMPGFLTGSGMPLRSTSPRGRFFLERLPNLSRKSSNKSIADAGKKINEGEQATRQQATNSNTADDATRKNPQNPSEQPKEQSAPIEEKNTIGKRALEIPDNNVLITPKENEKQPSITINLPTFEGFTSELSHKGKESTVTTKPRLEHLMPALPEGDVSMPLPMSGRASSKKYVYKYVESSSEECLHDPYERRRRRAVQQSPRHFDDQMSAQSIPIQVSKSTVERQRQLIESQRVDKLQYTVDCTFRNFLQPVNVYRRPKSYVVRDCDLSSGSDSDGQTRRRAHRRRPKSEYKNQTPTYRRFITEEDINTICPECGEPLGLQVMYVPYYIIIDHDHTTDKPRKKDVQCKQEYTAHHYVQESSGQERGFKKRQPRFSRDATPSGVSTHRDHRPSTDCQHVEQRTPNQTDRTPRHERDSTNVHKETAHSTSRHVSMIPRPSNTQDLASTQMKDSNLGKAQLNLQEGQNTNRTTESNNEAIECKNVPQEAQNKMVSSPRKSVAFTVPLNTEIKEIKPVCKPEIKKKPVVAERKPRFYGFSYEQLCEKQEKKYPPKPKPNTDKKKSAPPTPIRKPRITKPVVTPTKPKVVASPNSKFRPEVYMKKNAICTI